MPTSLMLNGESRRSTQTNDTTIGDADIATQGIDSAADYLTNIYKCNSGSGHKCKGKKLAQHTVVRPCRHLRQVTVTTMVYAVGTRRLRFRNTILMNVE